MTVFVPSDVRFETRAGNYIHYRLPLGLAKLGHKVYYSTPNYYWITQPDVDLSPLIWVSPKEWMDILKEVDLIVWVSNPHGWWGSANEFLDVLVKTKEPAVCYLCLDYWEGWLLGREWWKVKERETLLVKRSEYVAAVSPQLCSYLSSRYKRKVVWIPNASVPFPLYDRRENQKVVLIVSSFCPIRRCVGDIIKLSLLHPDWKFVWIGGESSPHKPTFPPFKYPHNLILKGERGNDEVISWARMASFGIVPAGRNWFSYFADPTKWYLYHMLKIPIISVNTPHHQKYPNFYPSTVTGWNLTEVFRRAVSSPPEPSEPKDFHTWDHRVDSFLRWISKGEIVYGYADGGKFHYTFV